MRKLLISAATMAFFALPPSAWPQPDHDRGHGGGGEQHGGPQGGGPAPQQEHGGPPGGGHFERGGPPAQQPAANPSFNRGQNGGNSGPAAINNPAYSRGPNGRAFNEPSPGANTAYTRGPNGRAYYERSPGANNAYSRGPNGQAFSEPSPGVNPGYTRGPNGGDNFRPQGAPGFAGSARGNFNRPSGERHDFHGFVDYHQNITAPRRFRAGEYRRPYGWYPHHWVFGEFLPAAYWARDYWLIDFIDFGLPPPPYGAVWVRVGYDALLIDQETGEIITVEYGVFY